MRKTVLFLMMASLTSLAFSQNGYFDFGVGFGDPFTTIDGVSVEYGMPESLSSLGMDFSTKLGFRLFGGAPLYLVGELSAISHRIYDDTEHVSLNSIVIGPGIIFYPFPFLQIGGSFGTGFVSNDSSYNIEFYDSEWGYGGNAYAAIDLGNDTFGLLLGAKYSRATSVLETSGFEQYSEILTAFVKLAYREL
jgi:hypothetical protein